MKPLSRILIVFAFALGMLNFQSPAMAKCQSNSSSLAASCPMPCCAKGRMPANCPMLKQTPPRDAISLSSPVQSPTLVFLHSIAQTSTIHAFKAVASAKGTVPSFYHQLLATDSPGRSPPASHIQA